MTNEEIFEIAKQAGFHYPSNDCLLVPFAKLVAQREREACAKVCEEMDHDGVMIAKDCADAIRKRSEK